MEYCVRPLERLLPASDVMPGKTVRHSTLSSLSLFSSAFIPVSFVASSDFDVGAHGRVVSVCWCWVHADRTVLWYFNFRNIHEFDVSMVHDIFFISFISLSF